MMTSHKCDGQTDVQTEQTTTASVRLRKSSRSKMIPGGGTIPNSMKIFISIY